MAIDEFVNDDSGDTEQVVVENIQTTKLMGRRLKNPLGAFSSYTYQLSLYMITPQAYDAFIATGRTQINSLEGPTQNPFNGVYLVAQSGGINNKNSIRASTNELDYYIDNLSIKTFLSGKATLTASVDTEVKFQITEPYGFSFLSDLKRVADLIYGDSPNISRPQNPTRQFFILGVKFIGYDANGNVVNTQNTKLQTSPESDLYRIQDRYFDILITDIKFKIAGGPSIYDITAVALAPRISFGIARGMITTNVSAEGKNVEEAIADVINKMTEDQKRIGERLSIPMNSYTVEWVGPEEDVRRLKESSILSLTEVENYANKAELPFNNTLNTEQSTEAQSADPLLTNRIVQIKNDTPVTQAITQIISQSRYITEALSVVYASETEPDSVTGSYDQTDSSSSNKRINWYTLGSEIRNARWIPKIQDFVYDIVYVIQPYETPTIQTPYGVNKDGYYGPYKRYDYWYTGKNSEVLSYEQKLDNAYFTVFLDTVTTDSTVESPKVAGRNDQPKLNNLTTGAEAQNATLTNLYDPASFATAQITILGDPDYLMPDSPASQQVLYDQFYAPDGLTINPHGGQTFIEINFKEARDYDIEKGYLTINDKILFWKYPEENQDQANNIEGISYMIIDVVSTFRSGSFKQTLNCIINPLSLVSSKPLQDSRTETTTENSEYVQGLLKEASDASTFGNPEFSVVPLNGKVFGNQIQDITEDTPIVE